MIERLTATAWVPPWVRHEHAARYAFAAQYVRGKQVVDCACGDGRGAVALAQAAARSVQAIDVSSEAAVDTRGRSAEAAVSYHTASATMLPIVRHTIDVYVSLETIEHVPSERGYLAEVLRVLTPDGLFICSTPNRTVTNPGTPMAQHPWNPFHVREYTPDEFISALQGAFHAIELYGQSPLSVRSVNRLEWIAKRLGARAAVRANQLRKLPRLVWSPAVRYAVAPIRPWQAPEYLIAVCRQPRPSLVEPVQPPSV